MSAFSISFKVTGPTRTTLRAAVDDIPPWLRSRGVFVRQPVITSIDDSDLGRDTSTVEVTGEGITDATDATELLARVVAALEELGAAKIWGASVYALGTETNVFDERDDLRARKPDESPAPPMSKQLADAQALTEVLVAVSAAAKEDAARLEERLKAVRDDAAVRHAETEAKAVAAQDQLRQLRQDTVAMRRRAPALEALAEAARSGGADAVADALKTLDALGV